MEDVLTAENHTKKEVIHLYHRILKSKRIHVNFDFLTTFTRLERLKRDRKQREKKSKEADGRKNLGNIRVVQRNLVYITNLALPSAKEEVRLSISSFSLLTAILLVVEKTRVFRPIWQNTKDCR